MVNSNSITKGLLKAIGILALVFLLLFFLYKIQMVIVYIAIAAVLSLIAKPIIIFLKGKLKFPNTLAVLTTMTFFILFFIGLISMLVPLIIEQGENLSLLNTTQLQLQIESVLIQVNDYFIQNNIDILSELKNADLFKNLTAIPNFLNALIGGLGSFGIGLFSVIFISFFLMKDSMLLENSIYIFVSEKSKTKLQQSIGTITHLLSRYFIGLVVQISVLFFIYFIFLAVFGVKNSFVIAFLCALLNIIPYIGPIIGGFLMLFLTMSSNLGSDFQTEILPTTIYVMIGYIFAQLLDNFISQPVIFSKSVKSHPLEIFLVIIISGILFGVVGMIVAVPTYTAIKVILKAFLSQNKIVKSLTKDI
jgi:predicted PurR-regulated permease PerM